MPDGSYVLHPHRRVEDRLPERERPRYSEADVEQIAAKAARMVDEMRSGEPTGVTQVPAHDPDVTAMRPSLYFSSRVVVVLVAIVFAATAVGGAVVGVYALLDSRVEGTLQRRGVLCPADLEKRHLCKSLPEQIVDLRETVETQGRETHAQLVELLSRIPPVGPSRTARQEPTL